MSGIEYDWGSDTKSTILSSFFWGYVITQIPGGPLAQKFGPKIFMTIALLSSSFFTLLTPLSADLGGWGLVCACRVIQGLGQGFIFPAVHTLLSNWSPSEERGRLCTYVYSGGQVGTVIAMPICGTLASSSIGWPSIFYIFGAIGIAWSVLWTFVGASSPSTCKFISSEERAYIEASTGSSQTTSESNLTLKLQNGLLSALPYLVMWILSFGFSWASDVLTNKNIVSTRISRKIFNTIGHGIPAIALIALASLPTNDTTISVVLLTVASDGSQWMIVFFTAAGIYIAGNMFFVFCGKAEIQMWNDSQRESTSMLVGVDKIAMKEAESKERY
ncbi:putative inorganic phosphate cotransporter [Blattella germanica]|nr:putative inorganic phosphate cotransporter [Blattella germanica]